MRAFTVMVCCWLALMMCVAKAVNMETKVTDKVAVIQDMPMPDNYLFDVDNDTFDGIFDDTFTGSAFNETQLDEDVKNLKAQLLAYIYSTYGVGSGAGLVLIIALVVIMRYVRRTRQLKLSHDQLQNQLAQSQLQVMTEAVPVPVADAKLPVPPV